jgi:hypothetical protein
MMGMRRVHVISIGLIIAACLTFGEGLAAADPISITQVQSIVNAVTLAEVYGVNESDQSGDVVDATGAAGFSLPKVTGDASQGFVNVSAAGLANPTTLTGISQAVAQFSFPSPESDVNLIGFAITRQFFTLDGIAPGTTGRILVDFEHLTVRPTDTADIDYTTWGQLSLFSGATQIASLMRLNPIAGPATSQLVFEGLLQPGVEYWLQVQAWSQVQSLSPMSGQSPQVLSKVSWTVSATADQAVAVPEPTSLLLFAIGVAGVAAKPKRRVTR